MSKITVSRKALADELGFIRNSISGKTNDNWAYILFEANGNILSLTGTDGMATAQTSVDLVEPIDTQTDFVIRGTAICDLITQLDEVDNVSFSVGETKTTITAGKGIRYSYGISPAAVDAIKGYLTLALDGPTFQINAVNFVNGLKAVSSFAAKEDTTQYALSGVTLEAKEDSLIMAAMGNSRGIDITLEENCPGRTGKLFIGRGYFNLVNTISNNNEASVVDVINAESAIRVSCGKRTAILRQIAGNVPAISQSITARFEEAEPICSVAASKLAKVIHRAATTVNAKYKRVCLNLEGGVLKIFTLANEGGAQEGEEELDIVSDKTLKVSFNADDAVDFLKLIEGDVNVLFVPKIKTASGLIMTDGKGMRYMMSLMN